MTVIYDWPVGSIPPAGQKFLAPGEAIDGGRTLGSVAIMHRAAGGYASLEYAFSSIGGDIPGRLFSWLMSAVRNGRVFRIPIVVGQQLVPAVDFGVAESLDWLGLPWENEQPWESGFNWAFNPVTVLTEAALEGETTLVLDMSSYGEILWHGHVFGIGRYAYLVDDIEYDEVGIATITVSPPVRHAVAAGDLVLFRPVMTAVCRSADSFEAMFDKSRIVRPGSITFVEAIVE